MIYGDELAYIHHVGFSDFSLQAAPAILQMLDVRGLQGGTVVDLGCGGGQLLRALTNAHYRAVGIDASPAFVRIAKSTAPEAVVRLGSIWSCKLPKCHAVTALGEVLSYLTAPTARAPSLRRMFSRVHKVLANDGVFIFDMLVQSPQQPMVYRTWRSGVDWAVMIDVAEDMVASRLVRNLEIFRREGRAYRRSVEKHSLRVVQRKDVVNLLREVGFTVRTSTKYGDYRLPPRRVVFYARPR